MKDTWNRLKENYGKNLPEIALMCVFVCASLALNASEIADSSKAVFGRNVNRPEGERQAGESGTERLRAEGLETESLSVEATGRKDSSGDETEMNGLPAGEMIEEPDRVRQNDSEFEEEAEGKLEETTSISRLYDLVDFNVLEQCPPVYPPRYYNLLQPQTIQKIPGPDGLVEYYGDKNPARNFSLLQKMLENRIAEFDGDWSVYVKNLSTQESLTVNDRPMKSASVMKLFIMGAVYRAMEAGELERTDEVTALLDNMVRVSDNDSSNQLLYMLGNSSYEAGIQEVNDFIAEYGFSDLTIEYNGFNSEETLLEEKKFNQVTAEDCGKLLEDIYHRNWVNRKVSSEIENMLLGQTTRYKIPAGLPEGVLCGNKTGEMDTTENDAAIVYAEHCDYILVVLSSDWSDGNAAISEIVSISELVYEFLNE